MSKSKIAQISHLVFLLLLLSRLQILFPALRLLINSSVVTYLPLTTPRLHEITEGTNFRSCLLASLQQDTVFLVKYLKATSLGALTTPDPSCNIVVVHL